MKRTAPNVELHVMFDTNIIDNKSPDHLLRLEVAELLQANYPDIKVDWCLPHVVRHEREYHMLTRASELLPNVKKFGELMGIDLNVNRENLAARVRDRVERELKLLGLRELSLDVTKVDWHRLILDAAYRQPPFEAGGKEKGFRDALIIETFVQFVDMLALSATNRIILVTADNLLKRAIELRLETGRHIAVMSDIVDVRSLLNTLTSALDEDLIAKYRSLAETVFFSGRDKKSFWYRSDIWGKITDDFESILEETPNDLIYRLNQVSRIHAPVFVAKKGPRITWSTRIDVSTQAYGEPNTETRSRVEQSSSHHPYSGIDVPVAADRTVSPGPIENAGDHGADVPHVDPFPISIEVMHGFRDGSPLMVPAVAAMAGLALFDVLWSTTVSVANDLASPRIEDIRYVGTTWDDGTTWNQ